MIYIFRKYSSIFEVLSLMKELEVILFVMIVVISNK